MKSVSEIANNIQFFKNKKAILSAAPSNAIFSPFSIKLLLSILAEAAGQDTSTQKELRSVLPSIMSLLEARELYGKTFGLLLVSNYFLFYCKIYSIFICAYNKLAKPTFVNLFIYYILFLKNPNALLFLIYSRGT